MHGYLGHMRLEPRSRDVNIVLRQLSANFIRVVIEYLTCYVAYILEVNSSFCEHKSLCRRYLALHVLELHGGPFPLRM